MFNVEDEAFGVYYEEHHFHFRRHNMQTLYNCYMIWSNLWLSVLSSLISKSQVNVFMWMSFNKYFVINFATRMNS
jgi:hypothetical protein